MRLLSPDIKASRSVLADWLEIQALISPAGRVGRAALDSIFRFTSEERSVRLSRDSTSNQRDDGEIIETELDTMIADVLQELEWRQDKLQDAYPFQLITARVGGLASGWELRGPGKTLALHNLIYVTCVIIVAYRRGLLEPNSLERQNFTNHKIGMIFQICACLALGGYIQGEVVSFGWPRAEGSSFLPALKAVWERFGAYKIVPTEPTGAPESLKDGGVDIIAWRNFADNRPSRLILFGQVASGDNWIDKSAREPAEVLTGYWFSGPRPKHWLPATLMPFVAHEEVGLESSEDVASSIFGRMEYYEQAHGLVFDRIRIVEASASAMAMISQGNTMIDGFDRIDEISRWVNSALGIEIVPTKDVAA